MSEEMSQEKESLPGRKLWAVNWEQALYILFIILAIACRL